LSARPRGSFSHFYFAQQVTLTIYAAIRKRFSMSNLNEVLPKKQLVEHFGGNVVFEEYGKSDFRTIAAKVPNCFHGLAANVWNRIVFRGWNAVDPQQLAPYFQTTDPNLHAAISEIIGAEVIRDIYYVKGWKKPKKTTNLIVEMLVAWVYRNDLQLGDITFRDPARPIPRRLRKFVDQEYQGLGLLPTLMENLRRKAEELGCEQLTLTAARKDQVNLFGRFGFVVENTISGRMAMRLGLGIPMERNVSAASDQT